MIGGPAHTQQVEHDAALFEDWSAGTDARGTWLWIAKVWGRDVFLVRAPGPRGAAIMQRLGATRRPRVGGPGSYPNGTEPWQLGIVHWRALRNVLPELVRERGAETTRLHYRDLPNWQPFEATLAPGGAVLAIFAGRPHPQDWRNRVFRQQEAGARAIGATVSTLFDRPLWHMPRRDHRVEAFRDLAAAARTYWI